MIDVRAAVNDLMRFVRHAMMPEAKGEFISRQSILLQLGVSDPRALFPCLSAIKKVERLIPREASRVVTERMLSGDQRICLHGEGGCGKTTALQEMRTSVASGLRCRHLRLLWWWPLPGFRRLSAPTADAPSSSSQTIWPVNSVSRCSSADQRNLDYPKVFKRRLAKAADVVASRARDALLVIAVDAMDNSVTAAEHRSPAERSFIHDFVLLGELPGNVRFVVKARTGRMYMLNLPLGFSQIQITGFTRNETAAHV